jgi:hypothetical protein
MSTSPVPAPVYADANFKYILEIENQLTLDNLNENIANIVNILISIYWSSYSGYDETYELQVSSIFTFLQENPKVLSHLKTFKNNLSEVLGDDTLEHCEDFQIQNEEYLELVFSWEFHNVHLNTCRRDVILSEFLKLGKKCQKLCSKDYKESYGTYLNIDFVSDFYAINSIFFVMDLLSQ